VTPHPRRFLLLSLNAVALFAVLAILVASNSAIVRLDHWISDGCYPFTMQHSGVRDFFRMVTDLGWGRFLNWVGAASIIVLLVRREWMRSLFWGLGLYAIHWIVPFVKDQFQRARPEFADIDGYSFPSGHAFGAASVYCILSLVLLRVWAGNRWRWLMAAAVWLLIPLVALSRIMLGVHYFSDVLAGMALGLAWAFALAAITEWWDTVRARDAASKPATTPPAPPGPSETDARS